MVLVFARRLFNLRCLLDLSIHDTRQNPLPTVTKSCYQELRCRCLWKVASQPVPRIRIRIRIRIAPQRSALALQRRRRRGGMPSGRADVATRPKLPQAQAGRAASNNRRF